MEHKEGSDVEQSGELEWKEEEDPMLLFFLAVHRGDMEVVISLLGSREVEVNARDRLGWTALHHAAFQGNVNLIRLLLHHDAQVNATNKEGYTPMHWAAVNGHADAFNLLVESNGNIKLKDIYGRTAVDLTPMKMKQKLILKEDKDHGKVRLAKSLVSLSRTPVARAILGFIIQVLLCMLLEIFHHHFARYYQLGVVMLFQFMNPFYQIFVGLFGPLLSLLSPIYALTAPILSTMARIVATRLNLLAKLILDLLAPFKDLLLLIFWSPVKYMFSSIFSVFFKPFLDLFSPYLLKASTIVINFIQYVGERAVISFRESLHLKKIVQWLFTPLIAFMKWTLQFLPSNLVLTIQALSIKLLGKRIIQSEASEDAALVVIFCFVLANYAMVFLSGYLWKSLMSFFNSDVEWSWAPNLEHHIYGINFLLLFLVSTMISQSILLAFSYALKRWHKIEEKVKRKVN